MDEIRQTASRRITKNMFCLRKRSSDNPKYGEKSGKPFRVGQTLTPIQPFISAAH